MMSLDDNYEAKSKKSMKAPSLTYETLINCQSTMGFWDVSSYSTILAFLKTKDLQKDKVILTMVALHILNTKFAD